MSRAKLSREQLEAIMRDIAQENMQLKPGAEVLLDDFIRVYKIELYEQALRRYYGRSIGEEKRFDP